MNPSDKPNSSKQQQGNKPQNARGDNRENPERGTESVSPPRIQTGGTEAGVEGSSGGGIVRPQGSEGGASGGGGNVRPQGSEGGVGAGGGGGKVRPQSTEGGASCGVAGGSYGGGKVIRPQGTEGGGGGGRDGQGCGDIVSTRKRGRSDDPGACSSEGQRPKRRGELDAPANVHPHCSLCGKRFGSWKAVFGHLRAHPRAWRGAYPPPTFNPEGSPERHPSPPPPFYLEGSPERQPILKEHLAPTLLNIARKTLKNMGMEGAAALSQERPRPSSSVANAGAGAGASSSSPSRRGGGPRIDLNETQEGAGPSSSRPKNGGFDLNMPPPEDEDEDDDDDDDDDDYDTA